VEKCFYSNPLWGLVAPESDTNRWNYKFTWAPRNVVLAGQGGQLNLFKKERTSIYPIAIYLEEQNFEVEDYGRFEAYSNRDSLKYRSVWIR
jgi:hypothetical protein